MELSATLLALVFLLTTVPKCRSLYYQMRPTISIVAGDYRFSEVGDYDPDYSSTRKDISSAALYAIDDENVGCPGYSLSEMNITLPSRGSYFVVMLPYVGTNRPCSEFTKAQTARNEWGASGLIFRYDPDDPLDGKLRDRPTQSQQLSGITIVVVKLALSLSLVDESIPFVSIMAHYHQFQASQTFYFIVFAFCILMLLSCLWFVMSYIKRCHYNVQRRQRRVSNSLPTGTIGINFPLLF